MSAWGDSWGSSWGVSWGDIAIIIVVGGGGGTRVLRRKLEQKFPHDADAIELIIILHEDSYADFE